MHKLRALTKQQNHSSLILHWRSGLTRTTYNVLPFSEYRLVSRVIPDNVAGFKGLHVFRSLARPADCYCTEEKEASELS